MFFLGEIYVDLALPASDPVSPHCGSCSACLDVCPTGAIVAPYRLDARRCISYLTIEHAGPIPEELRPLIGNRIYGCDDCQLVCPWNKFAQRSHLPDFDVRAGVSGRPLGELLAWTEAQFLHLTEGSAIRRIGHDRWLRNVAVAAGNALRQGEDPDLRAALQARAGHPSALVREHVAWALVQPAPPPSPGEGVKRGALHGKLSEFRLPPPPGEGWGGGATMLPTSRPLTLLHSLARLRERVGVRVTGCPYSASTVAGTIGITRADPTSGSRPQLAQSSPNSSAGCCVRSDPLPQASSFEAQNLSQPQQLRSGCGGFNGNFFAIGAGICVAMQSILSPCAQRGFAVTQAKGTVLASLQRRLGEHVAVMGNAFC